MSRKRRGRGEGSIFQRDDGLWVGKVSFGYDGTGKRQRRVIYAATKNEVQDKLRMLSSQAPSSEPAGLTVGQYLDRWLTNHAKPSVRPTTFVDYERIVRVHLRPILGGVKLRKLGSIHVENLYATMQDNGATAHTRRAAGTILGMALRHGVKLKLIPHNPAADIAKARLEDRELLVLTDDQTKRFLAAAKSKRLYALFALAIGSGMRQGELLALRWSDIDFQKGTVSVQRSLAQIKGEFVLKEPKSKTSRRTITLPRFALDALRDHRAAMLKEGNVSAPVFCTRTGEYNAKTNLIRKVFKPILQAANDAAINEAKERDTEPALLPPIRFHDLRHTAATSLLSRGQSIKAVSQRLGHAKVDITLRVYAHVLPNDDAKLADAVQLAFG